MPTDEQIFALRILSPEGECYDGEVASLILQTVAGEIEVLPRHEPLLACLNQGPVIARPFEKRDESICTISGGFLLVSDRGATILADGIESEDSSSDENA